MNLLNKLITISIISSICIFNLNAEIRKWVCPKCGKVIEAEAALGQLNGFFDQMRDHARSCFESSVRNPNSSFQYEKRQLANAVKTQKYQQKLAIYMRKVEQYKIDDQNLANAINSFQSSCDQYTSKIRIWESKVDNFSRNYSGRGLNDSEYRIAESIRNDLILEQSNLNAEANRLENIKSALISQDQVMNNRRRELEAERAALMKEKQSLEQELENMNK